MSKQQSRPTPKATTRPNASEIALAIKHVESKAIQDAVRGPQKKPLTPDQIRGAKMGFFS